MVSIWDFQGKRDIMSALFDQDDLDQCLIFLEAEAVVQNMLCQNCRDSGIKFCARAISSSSLSCLCSIYVSVLVISIKVFLK